MTVHLFHGPGAKEQASNLAPKCGRILYIQEDAKLNVQSARDVVDLLSSPPLGNQKGVVVLGPVDKSNPKALDVLLKTLEELDSSLFEVFMWADELSAVRPTIRSRSTPVYVPGLQSPTLESFSGFFDKHIADQLQVLTEHKSAPLDILQALAKDAFESQQWDQWASLKSTGVLEHGDVTWVEVVDAVLTVHDSRLEKMPGYNSSNSSPPQNSCPQPKATSTPSTQQNTVQTPTPKPKSSQSLYPIRVNTNFLRLGPNSEWSVLELKRVLYCIPKPFQRVKQPAHQASALLSCKWGEIHDAIRASFKLNNTPPEQEEAFARKWLHYLLVEKSYTTRLLQPYVAKDSGKRVLDIWSVGL